MSSTRDRSGSSSGFGLQDFGALREAGGQDAIAARSMTPDLTEHGAPSAPAHALPSNVHPVQRLAAHRDLSGTERIVSRFADNGQSADGSHASAVSMAQRAQDDHQVLIDNGTGFVFANASGPATSLLSAAQPLAPVNATDLATPQFAHDALASRQGDFHFDPVSHGVFHAPPPVAAVAGQLWAGCAGTGIGNPDGHSDFRIEHLDSDGLANDQLIEQEQFSSGINQTIGLDTSANLFFSMSEDFHLRVSNIATGAVLTDTVVASSHDVDVMNCFAVNPESNTLFAGLFGYDYLTHGGDIIKIGYNQSTGAITNPYTFNDGTNTGSVDPNFILIDSVSTGNVYADARAMYLSHDDSTLYYVDDNDNDPGNFWHFSTNGVFKVSTTGSVGGGNAPTPVLLSSQAQFPVNDSNGFINGIAVDESRGIIYFTTASSGPGVNVSQNAIWWMPITGGTATQMAIPGGVSVTYPTFFGDPIELDQKSHIMYYADQVTGEMVQFVLSADGHSFTSASNFSLFDTNHTSDGAYVNALLFDDLPTLGSLSATSTEAVQGGSAITLLTATPSITDTDNQRLNHFTITITNAQTGDNLFCNGAQSGTQSGVTISWNSSTHTLTLSGDVAFSTYQTLLTQITYQDSGTDNSIGSHPTRTINWTASDGVTIAHPTTADSNEQTTTVVIDRAPTLTADNYPVVEAATVTGTSGTGGTGVLGNDTDKDGDAIVVTQVNGSAANVGNSVAGTYGHLTLNANGSYSYIADNAVNIAAGATGSHLVDTFTYQVSDGLGGLSTTTASFTIDRIPTVVADNPPGEALESGSAISGNVLTNDSDRDGDTLTVSQVDGSAGNVGNSVAGTYGHLTLNANGTYTYSADITSAIDSAATGSHLTDTFTYQASDGHGGFATQTITVTVDRPPTVVADNPATQAVESGAGLTGNVLTNDSDRDGDGLSVQSVNGSSGNVGTFIAGTYGHIKVNSDGSYTYNADNTSAIDGAPTGSHLTDAFTYTASDGLGGTSTTTITVTIDRAPTVVNDGTNLSEGGTVQTSTFATGVLGNDSDRDGDTLAVSAVAGSGANVGVNIATTFGHITLNADGTYTYNADNTAAIDAAPNGSHPVDTITFTVSDGNGGTTDETLSFTIDRAASATADSLSTLENAQAVNGSGGNANLLANDQDKDGDAITITAVNGSGANVGTQIALASGALLTVNADGTYVYDPNHAFDYLPAAGSGASNTTATDTFTYTVDGGSTVTVTVTITGVDSNDILIGTIGDDTMHGGIGDDQITALTGNDTLFGDSGNDTFVMGANLTAADKIDGGTNSDTVQLDGDYSAGVVFNATTMVNVEFLQLATGHDYNLTTDDATVGAGQVLTLQAGQLGAGDNVIFDGSAETDGKFMITTGAGNDTLTGGAGNDHFNSGSGNDTINGGGGNDTIGMAGFLTAADHIDGGSGTDTVVLNGDYSAGLSFGATTMVNVEYLTLTTGFSYNLTTNDATVAAGKTLTIRGGMLAPGQSLTFNGSAETDGNFVINAGAGDDVITGGMGNDIIRTGLGVDTVHAGGGDDTINDNAFLTAADTIDGGTGTDTLFLNGDYSAGLVLGATTVTNVELFDLASGHSYNLTTNDATVASGQTLTVKANGLGAGDSLTFNGSAETNGNFDITAGAGDDVLTGGTGNDFLRGGSGTNTLTGGGGQDNLQGGAGVDTFVYNAVSDSTSTGFDIVHGFDASNDIFHLAGITVNAIDTAVTSGHLALATFDANLAQYIGAAQLGAHDAVLFTPDKGALHGHTFLIVDVNGVAGYQAGQDLVIELDNGHNLGSLSTGDFTS